MNPIIRPARTSDIKQLRHIIDAYALRRRFLRWQRRRIGAKQPTGFYGARVSRDFHDGWLRSHGIASQLAR